MLEKLYKKENNLFQSLNWLSFQESLGRKAIYFDKNECNGLVVELPFGKKFIWVQKSPEKSNLNELQEMGAKEGAVFVRIEPKTKPAAGKYVSNKSLLSGQKSPEATSVLDISKDSEDILAQMKSKTRYNIRLAEKKGVKVRISADPKDTDILFGLLKQTAAKNKGFYHFPKEHYTKIMEELGKNDVARLIIAEYESTPLCALLITTFGEVATYLHGGSSEKHKEVMAPYLCQWEAIKYAKNAGCKIYDFWGVAKTDDPKDSWAGITKFKEGFGGEKVVFPGAFDIPIDKFWYNLLTILAKAKRIIG